MDAPSITVLRDELESLETETFEIQDHVEHGTEYAYECSCSSTSSSLSTCSCTSTCSSCSSSASSS